MNLKLDRQTGKALSESLRKMATEPVSVTDDGTPITRAEKLAAYIWKIAEGWWEEGLDKDFKPFKVWHKPEDWAIKFIFERNEGKAAQAMTEEQPGIRALDKVRELSKDRLNKLAKAGPPGYKPKI